MLRLALVTILFLSVTAEASAAISINEVAWMGGSTSANHEWIELIHSGGSEISVDGWTLSDGMNLSIPLSGSIAGGSYAVLERSSEDSAPGTAFLIYTGALVNTGATLVLRDAGGGIVDQVVGGVDWQNIGGDNATKETAQYTSAGWVTDTATPGQANRSGRVEVEEDEDEEETVSSTTPPSSTPKNTSTNTRAKSSSATVRLGSNDTYLTVTPDAPTVAYVNQSVQFTASVRGNYKGSESMVRLHWNFGDGHATSGKWVEHMYEYPGEYVVTVEATHKSSKEAVRHEITVLPVTFSLTQNDDGDIQVHNDALYDVDISNFVLKGTKTFIFPPRTIMLPRATITIPREKVGSGSHMVALYDAKKIFITSTLESAFGAASSESVELAPKMAVDAPVVSTPAPFSFGIPKAEAEGLEMTAGEVISIPAEVSGESSAKPSSRTWYLAVIGLFSLLFLGVLLVPAKTTG